MTAQNVLKDKQSIKPQGFTVSRNLRKTLTFYGFISPWLLGFIFLTLVPVAVGIWLSFTNYNGLNFESVAYVGLRWYKRIPNDRQAMTSLRIVFRVDSVEYAYLVAIVILAGLHHAQDYTVSRGLPHPVVSTERDSTRRCGMVMAHIASRELRPRQSDHKHRRTRHIHPLADGVCSHFTHHDFRVDGIG